MTGLARPAQGLHHYGDQSVLTGDWLWADPRSRNLAEVRVSAHSTREVTHATSASTTATRTRRRTSRARSDTAAIIGQVTQLVTANETLKLENAELRAVNENLRSQLLEISSALGRLTGGPRRGRGRLGAEMAVLAEAKPKRTRKPITDPEQLERRRQALAKARAARAEKLAAAREGAATGE